MSLVAAGLGAVLALATAPAAGATPTPAEIARGKYIFGATGGCGCHTEPGKPALITGKPAPDEQPDYRYLLMPIRLGA